MTTIQIENKKQEFDLDNFEWNEEVDKNFNLLKTFADMEENQNLYKWIATTIKPQYGGGGTEYFFVGGSTLDEAVKLAKEFVEFCNEQFEDIYEAHPLAVKARLNHIFRNDNDGRFLIKNMLM